MHSSTKLKTIGFLTSWIAITLPCYGATTSRAIITTNVTAAASVELTQDPQITLVAGEIRGGTLLANMTLTPTGNPSVSIKCDGNQLDPRYADLTETSGSNRVINGIVNPKVSDSFSAITGSGWVSTSGLSAAMGFTITTRGDQTITPGTYSTSCTASVYSG